METKEFTCPVPDEALQLAADWWADRLFGSKMPNMNNGDNSALGGIGWALMTQAVMANPLPDATQRSKYTEAFIAFVKEKLQWAMRNDCDNPRNVSVTISTDSGPEYSLQQIEKKSGVSRIRNYPIKTDMYIYTDHVQVCNHVIWSKENSVIVHVYFIHKIGDKIPETEEDFYKVETEYETRVNPGALCVNRPDYSIRRSREEMLSIDDSHDTYDVIAYGTDLQDAALNLRKWLALGMDKTVPVNAWVLNESQLTQWKQG